MSEANLIYTTSEAAKALGTTPRHVCQLFDRGQIRGYRIPGSQDRRIPSEHLERYARDNGMTLHPIQEDVAT